MTLYEKHEVIAIQSYLKKRSLLPQKAKMRSHISLKQLSFNKIVNAQILFTWIIPRVIIFHPLLN